MDGLEPLGPWDPSRTNGTMNGRRLTVWLGTLLSGNHVSWRAARKRRAGTSQLHAMSDRELKDIGLCRSDLGNAV